MSNLVIKLVFIVLVILPCGNGKPYYYNANNYFSYYPYYQQPQGYAYNVVTQPPAPIIQPLIIPTPQCARLYDTHDFYGRTLEFKDDDKRTDLAAYYFYPKAVKISPQCSLTVFDNYGSKYVIQKDEKYLWMWNRQISASCCECNHCNGESAMKGLQCARLYEYENCNGCTGFRLDFKNGDRVKSFGVLDNKMSSLAIRPGCHLITYFKRDYEGWRYNFTNSVNLLGDNWYKQISSAECHCSDDKTGVITKSPPMTLPTVPTTTTPYYSPKPTVSSTTSTSYWTIPTYYTPKTTSKPTTTSTLVPNKQESSEGWDDSNEEIPSTTIPATTEKLIEFEEGNESGWPESEEEETTTTVRPTTTTTTEDPDDDDDWSNSDEDSYEEIVTTTVKKTKTTEATLVEADDGLGFGSESEEDETTTTVRTTTTTTTTPSDGDEDEFGWGNESEEEETTTITSTTVTFTTTTTEEPEDNDEEFGWGDASEEQEETGTMKATTTEESKENEEDDEFGWGNDSEEEKIVNRIEKPVTTTSTTTSQSSKDDDDGFGWEESEETTTRPKPIVQKEPTEEEKESAENSFEDDDDFW